MYHKLRPINKFKYTPSFFIVSQRIKNKIQVKLRLSINSTFKEISFNFIPLLTSQNINKHKGTLYIKKELQEPPPKIKTILIFTIIFYQIACS